MCYDHLTSHLTKSRLAELLERNKMTIDEMARRIGASGETLKAIQDGRYDPPLSLAYKLAAALDIPVERLFDDKDGTYYEC